MPLRYKCAVCGQAAELKRVRRDELSTFRDRLKPSLTVGLLGHPLASIFACGFLFSLSVVMGPVGHVLGLVGTLIAGLGIMRATGEDQRFDWMRFSDPVEEVAMPLARGLLALLPVLIAVLIGIKHGVADAYDIEVRHTHTFPVTLMLSPVFWLISLLTIAYAPMALLNATTAQTWGDPINPVPLVQRARTWRQEYGWISLVAGVGFLVTLLLAALTPSSWFGCVLVGVSAAATGILSMKVVGELLYLHPEELGWGGPDEAWIDLGDPNAPAMEEAPAHSSAPPPRAAAASLESRVRAALDAKDAQLALQLFREAPTADQELTPATLTRVGQAAASVEEYSVALSALLAASRTDAPESARPLVIAAMILDERLRDHRGAKRLYQQVVQRFPGTQAAQKAERELADPRFFLESSTG